QVQSLLDGLTNNNYNVMQTVFKCAAQRICLFIPHISVLGILINTCLVGEKESGTARHSIANAFAASRAAFDASSFGAQAHALPTAAYLHQQAQQQPAMFAVPPPPHFSAPPPS